MAAGVISVDTTPSLAERLSDLHSRLIKVIDEFSPDEASIEIVFVNKNPESTLKLGQARGVVLLAPALKRLPIGEYTPNQIKKMIVGVGHADKNQVDMMVRKMLPTLPENIPPDASDALAIALCHGFMRNVIT